MIKPMDTYFKIEKNYRSENKGEKEILPGQVQSYPEKFNAWVPAKDIKKL